MITVLVNFRDASESTYRSNGDYIEVVKAVKLLHPDWTSLVLTIVNSHAPATAMKGA